MKIQYGCTCPCSGFDTYQQWFLLGSTAYQNISDLICSLLYTLYVFTDSTLKCDEM